MSVPERNAPFAADGDARGAVRRGAPQRFGTIVVVGGGCYGSYYVRQLTRARDAGAIEYGRVLVVDRDPDCRVARVSRSAAAGIPVEEAAGATSWHVPAHHFSAVELTIASWEDFLPAFFDAVAADPARHAIDAVVPSPLMPHLTRDWLVARARRLWPGRSVRCPPLEVAPPTPWQRASADGETHYASFAEWMCPINCVEPRRCPETRGERTWSMPVAARDWVAAAAARGRPVVGPLLFHCEHRAYGVGMFDARAAADAARALDDAVAAAGTEGTVRALVASVSHCHGAWSVVQVGPEA